MIGSEHGSNGQLVVTSEDGRFVETHELIADGRGGLRSRLVSRSPVPGSSYGTAPGRCAERQAVRRLLLDIFAPAPKTGE